MALLIKPGDAWQEPEHIRSQNPDGVLRDVEVVRAKIGSEYVDVWSTKLWLYREGDECSAVTGGWTGSTVAGTVSKGTDHLYTKMNDFQGPEGVYDTRYAQFYTNQKVNLTHYKYLYIDGYHTGQTGEIAFLETKKNIVYTVVVKLKRYFFKNGSRGIIKYDISQLSGEFYIALYALWTSDQQLKGQCWLYNLWVSNQ